MPVLFISYRYCRVNIWFCNFTALHIDLNCRMVDCTVINTYTHSIDNIFAQTIMVKRYVGLLLVIKKDRGHNHAFSKYNVYFNRGTAIKIQTHAHVNLDISAPVHMSRDDRRRKRLIGCLVTNTWVVTVRIRNKLVNKQQKLQL